MGERLMPTISVRKNRPRFVDWQVHDMRNNRLPAAVYVAVSPDDIRVIGAVNNNSTSNDTRGMRTTRKVRGKVANVWKAAPTTTTTGFCRRCERRDCNCGERNHCHC
jgi:hypothetical protein